MDNQILRGIAFLFVLPLLSAVSLAPLPALAEPARPEFGRIEKFTAADEVCYVTLRTDRGELLEEIAHASLCAKSRSLTGRRLKFSWGPGFLGGANCAGRANCPERAPVTLMKSALPVEARRSEGTR